MSMNEKLVIDPVDKNFIIQRIIWILILVWVLVYVVITWTWMSEAKKQELFYDESDMTLGIAVKDSDKSAFESLTEKDIEKQFNEVVWNLNINKVNYSINTRNIWVNNPFLTWDTPGNKYIDKDLQEKINAAKWNAANVNATPSNIQWANNVNTWTWTTR